MKTILDFIPDIERAKLSPELHQAILKILSAHIGAKSAIGGKDLLTILRRSGHPIDQRRMRLAISTLRRRGNLICSAPGIHGGYYLPQNEREFTDFLNTEYLAKICDMQETVNTMRAHARRVFTPTQLDLL